MGFWLNFSSEVAHEASFWALPIYSRLFGLSKPPTWQPFTWRGIHFPNRLGLAGGMDKNGEHVMDWWRLGAGFVEVGTVTPRPQSPNPGKIMDRNNDLFAVWNKMGFPNKGSKEIVANLRHLPIKRSPLFVNIGKNRDTENQRAQDDYLQLIAEFKNEADVFVVNISSPNTKDLRLLQEESRLKKFLEPLVGAGKAAGKPVLLKLSPDNSSTDLAQVIQNADSIGIDGYVLTNTTLQRAPGLEFPADGGVSGKPLKLLSEDALQTCIDCLGARRKDKLIVSVGGVMDAADVKKRLQMGADLVEAYTALVFNGPNFLLAVAKKMSES